MPVHVSSAITSGSSEVSRGEEEDSACDVALTSDLGSHRPYESSG